MGVWSINAGVGNIIAEHMVGMELRYMGLTWEHALLLAAFISFLVGLTLFLVVTVGPQKVVNVKISFLETMKIRNVALYAGAYGFEKMMYYGCSL